MVNLLNPVIKPLSRLWGGIGRKRFLVGIVVIAAAMLVGYHYLWTTRKTDGQYITSTVNRGTVTSTISATGTIEPVTTVSLGFENSGIITKLNVTVGDHVTAGYLLAEQDSTNLEAEVIQSSASLKSAIAKLQALKDGATEEEIAQSEASVKVAQASYELSKATLERTQSLFDAGASSQVDLNQASYDCINAEANLIKAQESLKTLMAGNTAADIAAAEATLESCQAQLKIVQASLAGAKLYSPIDGIVSEVNGAEGQRAAANNNSTSSSSGLITLISTDLQLEAQVNETDIGKLAVGQKVEFTVNAFSNKTFTGSVSSVSPTAATESNVQIYTTMIRLDSGQQGLLAGMPANITIIVDKQENVLTIPKGAVTYASTYLSQSGQSLSGPPPTTAAGPTGGPTGGTTGVASGSPNNSPDSGLAHETGASSTAKETTQKQRSMVLILDDSGNPTTRQVVLGLTDQKNYVVSEGLNEGEIVIVGTSGSSSNTSTSSSSNTSRSSGSASPLMPGGGGGPPP